MEFLVNQDYSSKNVISHKIENDKEFDFFISHASEDKDEIVKDLADALKENGFEIWYDDFELKIGDSLRKKIDKDFKVKLIHTRSGFGYYLNPL